MEDNKDKNKFIHIKVKLHVTTQGKKLKKKTCIEQQGAKHNETECILITLDWSEVYNLYH